MWVSMFAVVSADGEGVFALTCLYVYRQSFFQGVSLGSVFRVFRASQFSVLLFEAQHLLWGITEPDLPMTWKPQSFNIVGVDWKQHYLTFSPLNSFPGFALSLCCSCASFPSKLRTVRMFLVALQVSCPVDWQGLFQMWGGSGTSELFPGLSLEFSAALEQLLVTQQNLSPRRSHS